MNKTILRIRAHFDCIQKVDALCCKNNRFTSEAVYRIQLGAMRQKSRTLTVEFYCNNPETRQLINKCVKKALTCSQGAVSIRIAK